MRRAASAILCLALLLALAGCAPQARTATVFAMDTVMELTAYGDREAVDGAVSLIHALEARLSVTAADSDIARVNSSGGGAVDPGTAALLRRALDISALSGGALDVTIYPLVRAWGFTTGEYRVPGDDEIGALLKNVNYAAVQAGEASVSLPTGALLDLGAVAKGWTGDQIAALWRQAGVKSGLINLGGNVQTVGGKPDGSDWVVGIRDPFSEDVLGAIAARDLAVVTSGGYQRYFEREGVRYCHIIDPRTGKPADSGLASVTVIGREGVLCDGLSTALYVMGPEDAVRLWRENTGFDLVLVTDGGQVVITEGIEGSFTPMGAYTDKEIKVMRRG